VFGTYFFIFGDPSYFPLGDPGFMESVQSPGVLQHWLLAAMMAGVGWFEWRTRQEWFMHRHWCYLFPAVCLAAGIMLLAHSHSLYRLKAEYLTLATHVAIGASVVIAGGARWLELRSSPPVERIAGLVSSGALLLVGLILLFYVDPEDGATWERLKES
jgi:putative copper resistance protein D